MTNVALSWSTVWVKTHYHVIIVCKDTNQHKGGQLILQRGHTTMLKELELVLSRTEFTLLVLPLTAITISHVRPRENDLTILAVGGETILKRHHGFELKQTQNYI